jgi:hypothetical protein
MKNYLAGIICGALGAIAFAFLVATLTGHDWIGYSMESRFVVGGIFGGGVAALAGLPRLFNRARFGSFIATVLSAAIVGWLAWAAECYFMPGSNAGFSLYYAVTTGIIGAWIGASMWLGTRWLPGNRRQVNQ